MQPTTQQLQEYGLAEIRKRGHQLIIGVDEVGYGCIAGPVTVCAAVAYADWNDPRVKDSKKLERVQHLKLVKDVLVPPVVAFYVIMNHASTVVDELGVNKARNDLVRMAVAACRVHYPDALAVMDGAEIPADIQNVLCMPKADHLVKAVSAASILAKADRDELMILLADEYPKYGFHTNVGYGTDQHMAALERFGPCPVHRFSYRNIKEVAAKFGMGPAASSKPSQNQGAPARILGWQRLPKGMRASTSSKKP